MDHITTPKVDNVRLLDRLNPPMPTSGGSGGGGSGAANAAASRLAAAAAASREGDATGTLYLTTTHLIFVDSQRYYYVVPLHLNKYNIDDNRSNVGTNHFILL